MMSSQFSEEELFHNHNGLTGKNTVENESNNQLNLNIEDFTNDNLVLLNEIQAILKNCIFLTDKQKLDYCSSQRYFMKLYLKEINKRK